MLKKFSSHILQKKFFSKRATLLVAVSGGVDSVVLCNLLFQLGYKFSIAHCNFQLRGAESDAEENFCIDLAKEMNVKIFTKKFHTKNYAKQKKVSIQMAARELRYEWFNQLQATNPKVSSKKKNNLFLLTAHHLNDNLETVLLNFTRGTGIKGLKGIPEKVEQIIRPLLIFTKQEILNFAENNGIKFCEDSSNYEEKYARNLLRKKVIPILKKLNPALEKTVLNNLFLINQHANLLNEFTNEKKKIFLKKEAGSWIVNLTDLKKEKYFNFFLFEILAPFGFNSEQCKMAGRLINAHSGKIIVSDKFTLLKDRNTFIINEKKEPAFKQISIKNFPCSIFSKVNISFELVENKNFTVTKSLRAACFDFDKFTGTTVLRKWKNGDTFHPFGMKGTKKLSDYFTSKKLNIFEKQNTLILENDKRIAWIVGHRIDNRFAVTSTTQTVLVANFFK